MIVQALLLSATLDAAHANARAVFIFNPVVPDKVVVPTTADTQDIKLNKYSKFFLEKILTLYFFRRTTEPI